MVRWTHFSLAWLSDGAVDPLPLAYIAEVSWVIDGRKYEDDDVDAVTLTALSIIIYPPLSFLPLPPHSLCCVYVRNLGSATTAAAVIELCWVKPENLPKLSSDI